VNPLFVGRQMLWKPQPKASQQAANGIFNIYAGLQRDLSSLQQSAALLGNSAFDFDFLVEPGSSQLCQHGGIVVIGLVVHLAKDCVRLSGINANNRQASIR